MTLRVFLVDDEPPARARMRQLLGELGGVIVVGEAEDADSAREAIAAAQPDVLFLDIEMPEISGTTLARSLPEPRPFVVFATAYDRYAIEAFALEATDYLVKPITRARLAATLARVRDRLSRRSDLERELAAASAAQAALVPRTMPAMAGFDASALTLPARGVGGDFLVAQRIDDERFVLALGDVAGKGMPAGLIASSLQARLEAIARHGSASAEDVVADVNRALCATTDSARFATLVYLDVDARGGNVTVVNAGHLPPLHLPANGEPVNLASTGPALGLLPDARFSGVRVAMDAGALLFVYSDGVTEACGESDDEFGAARMAKTVAEHVAASAEDVCRAVVDAVRRHAPGPAGDDLSVLALRRTARAAIAAEAMGT